MELIGLQNIVIICITINLSFCSPVSKNFAFHLIPELVSVANVSPWPIPLHDWMSCSKCALSRLQQKGHLLCHGLRYPSTSSFSFYIFCLFDVNDILGKKLLNMSWSINFLLFNDHFLVPVKCIFIWTVWGMLRSTDPFE